MSPSLRPVAGLLLLGILGLGACSVFSSPPSEQQLVGRWQWIRSTGGFGGWTVTPDSAGYSERLRVFLPHNQFLAFRGDSLFRAGRYSVAETEAGPTIRYNADNGRGAFRLSTRSSALRAPTR